MDHLTRRPMPPLPKELLADWWFFADYCSKTEPYETPVSESILNALGQHYQLAPKSPEIPPGVSSWRWDDEWSPTAPATMSAREAAVWLLHAADWAQVLEQHDEWAPMDPLVWYGLVDRLSDANYLPNWRRTDKLASHLIAWVASRLEKKSWCTNPEHHDEMIPFNDCWHGDEPDSPCQWEQCWALTTEPSNLIAVATEIVRDGWEPPITAEQLADDRHVIEFRDDGWTIAHPLSERLNLDSLFDCQHRWNDVDPGVRGRFELINPTTIGGRIQ